MTSCDSMIQKAMRERAHSESAREEAALANPFTRPSMREQFADALYWYKNRDSRLFEDNGTRNSRRKGYWFWLGYDGNDWPLAYNQTKAYATYRAGKACRDAEGGLP